MRHPGLILWLLLTCCLTLTGWVLREDALRSRGSARGALAVLFGDGRRLFANHFLAKADAYFHRGRYPSIFEMAERAFVDNKYSQPVTITWEGKSSEPAKTEDAPFSPDYQRAMDDYNKALSLQPGNAFAYFNRANIKVRLKDYTGAIQDYSRAIEFEPGLAEAFFNRALTLIYLNDTRSACIDLSRAGELGLDKAYKVIKQYCKTPHSN